MQPPASLHVPTPIPTGTAAGTTSPFGLEPGKDDTALYKDARAAFSHLLPGRPVLGLGGRPGEPPADAVIHLQDAPITVRYALAPPAFAVPDALEAVRLTASSYAGWRSNEQVSIDFANPTWLASWGVEAAAVAAYDVGGRDGAQREDIFVLAKNRLLMTVTWTYPRGFIHDPAYATFASVAEATMVWDSARWEQRGRVWPESVFVGPGLYGRPRPKHNDLAKTIAVTPIPPDEAAHLLALLSSIVSSAGAPWVPLTPDTIDADVRSLLAATRSPAVHAFIKTAFADVRTAHDLRGLAVMLGRAVDGQVAGTTSSAPPPPPMPAVRIVKA
jgi:hypothetical protein